MDELFNLLKTIGWTCKRCGAKGNGQDEVSEHIKKYNLLEDD